jgi:hypothetical protein
MVCQAGQKPGRLILRAFCERVESSIDENLGINELPYLLSVSSFIFLQMSRVCPVFESITVLTGTQLQVTVLAFSCVVTTQCSMISAVAGGNWLRGGGGVVSTGGGVAAAGCFFAAQPVSRRHSTRQPSFMLSVFAPSAAIVDGKLGYRRRAGEPSELD